MNVSYEITATLRAEMSSHAPVVLIYDARGNGGQNMPNDHRRSPEPDNGLYRTCYSEVRFCKWVENDKSVSLRAQSGSYGGGSEVLIIEPISFRDDITIKVDGGALPSLSEPEISKESNA